MTTVYITEHSLTDLGRPYHHSRDCRRLDQADHVLERELDQVDRRPCDSCTGPIDAGGQFRLADHVSTLDPEDVGLEPIDDAKQQGGPV